MQWMANSAPLSISLTVISCHYISSRTCSLIKEDGLHILHYKQQVGKKHMKKSSTDGTIQGVVPSPQHRVYESLLYPTREKSSFNKRLHNKNEKWCVLNLIQSNVQAFCFLSLISSLWKMNINTKWEWLVVGFGWFTSASNSLVFEVIII